MMDEGGGFGRMGTVCPGYMVEPRDLLRLCCIFFFVVVGNDLIGTF